MIQQATSHSINSSPKTKKCCKIEKIRRGILTSDIGLVRPGRLNFFLTSEIGLIRPGS